jgi:hypothetical protein
MTGLYLWTHDRLRYSFALSDKGTIALATVPPSTDIQHALSPRLSMPPGYERDGRSGRHPTPDAEAHSRARLLNVSNRDGIVLARISITTRTHTQTQPLPSVPSIALYTLLVDCPPYMSAIVTDENAVVQRCYRCCLEDSPCAMTRTTSCLRHWLLTSSPRTGH